MSKPATTDWNTMESWKRLVTSIQATGAKIDLKEAAKYFETTEGALQWQFRAIKKDAKVLKDKVDSKISAGDTPSCTKSVPATPKKTPKKDGIHTVANGYVSKTPGKKARGEKKSVNEDDADDAENLNGGGMGGIKGEDDDIFSRFTYEDEDGEEAVF